MTLPLRAERLLSETLRRDIELTCVPRASSFMCHPEMLLPIPEIDDPYERFVSVVKFYLSGWHIRPSFVLAPIPIDALRQN